jgi:hypothetical protein
MAAAVWRIEFDRAAARELRMLGIEAERRVLAYLRTRIAGSGARSIAEAAGRILGRGPAAQYASLLHPTRCRLHPAANDPKRSSPNSPAALVCPNLG